MLNNRIEISPAWAAFLKEVDDHLTETVVVQCLGGFVLTVLYGVPRVTGDLDYIETCPDQASLLLEELAGRDSKLHSKHKLYFQRAGGVTDLPENYEGRLIDLPLGLKHLHLKALEPHDLALSKLSRNSPKDREDVKYLAKHLRLDFSVIRQRFETEMKPLLPNSDRHESTLQVVWKEYFVRDVTPE